MKSNWFVLYFLFFVGVSALARGQEANQDTLYLDFNASVQMMEKQNQQIESARLQKEKARMDKKAATGMYFPSIGASASYAMMSESLELDLTPVKNAITPLYETLIQYGSFNPEAASPLIKQGLTQGLQQIEQGEWVKEIQKDQFGLVDVNFTWALYAGGRIRLANKAAEVRKQEAENNYQQTWSEQHVELVQRYFGLQLVREVAQLRKEVMEGMAKHLHDAKRLEANGMMAEAERLHAEVAYADAEKEYKKAMKDVELMETALKNTLATDQPVVPVSDLFIEPTLKSRTYFVESALANNPQLRQISAKQQLANLNVKKEQAAFLPNVALMGTKEVYEHDLSEYMPDWFIGVGLQINIFDGLTKFRKVDAAKIQVQQVGAIREKAQADIVTLVTKTHQQMEKALEEYQATETSLKFANEYVRVREKAFREGFATSTDVVDAQLNLFKVQTEQLQAMYAYELAWARLLAVAGVNDEFRETL
ncbi:MAG: TolC family protein [Bacteroidales bacterium]